MYVEVVSLLSSMCVVLRFTSLIRASALGAATLLVVTQMHAATYSVGSTAFDAENTDGGNTKLKSGDILNLSQNMHNKDLDLSGGLGVDDATDVSTSNQSTVTLNMREYTYRYGTFKLPAGQTLNVTATTGGMLGISNSSVIEAGSTFNYTQTGTVSDARFPSYFSNASGTVTINANQTHEFYVHHAQALVIGDNVDYRDSEGRIRVYGDHGYIHTFTLKNGAKFNLNHFNSDLGGGSHGTHAKLVYYAVIDGEDVELVGAFTSAAKGSLDRVTFNEAPSETNAATLASNYKAVLTVSEIVNKSTPAGLENFKGDAALGSSGQTTRLVYETSTGIGIVLPAFNGIPQIRLDPDNNVASIPGGITITNADADGKLTYDNLTTTNSTTLKNTTVTLASDVIEDNFDTFAYTWLNTAGGNNTVRVEAGAFLPTASNFAGVTSVISNVSEVSGQENAATSLSDLAGIVSGGVINAVGTPDADSDLNLSGSDDSLVLTFANAATEWNGGDLVIDEKITLDMTATTGGVKATGTITPGGGTFRTYKQLGVAGDDVDIDAIPFQTAELSAAQTNQFTIDHATRVELQSDFSSTHTPAIIFTNSNNDEATVVVKDGAAIATNQVAGSAGNLAKVTFELGVAPGVVSSGAAGTNVAAIEYAFSAPLTLSVADHAANLPGLVGASSVANATVVATQDNALTSFTGDAKLGQSGQAMTVKFTSTGDAIVMPESAGQVSLVLDTSSNNATIPAGLTVVNAAADGKIQAGSVTTTNNTVLTNTTVTFDAVDSGALDTFATTFLNVAGSNNIAIIKASSAGGNVVFPSGYEGASFTLTSGVYGTLTIGNHTDGAGVATQNVTLDTTTANIDKIELFDSGTITLVNGGLNFDKIKRHVGSNATVATAGIEIEGRYEVENYSIGDINTGGYSLSFINSDGVSAESFVGKSQAGVMNVKLQLASTAVSDAMYNAVTGGASFNVSHYEEKAREGFNAVDGMVYQTGMAKVVDMNGISFSALGSVYAASYDSGFIHADSRVASFGMATDVMSAKAGMMFSHESFSAGKEQRDGFLGGSGVATGNGAAFFVAKGGLVNKQLSYMMGVSMSTSKLGSVEIGPLVWDKHVTSVVSSQFGLDYRFASGFTLGGYASSQVVVKGATQKVKAYSAVNAFDASSSDIDFTFAKPASWLAGIEAGYITNSGLKTLVFAKAGSGKFTAYGLKVSSSS